MNANNPYHRGAGLYEIKLALPFISTIRRQEARAVGELIRRYSDRQGRALEVGPGTGFYTLALARAFGEVVAVEDSSTMARMLTERLAAAGARNVTVVNHDFLALPLDGGFDVAAAIGVLDYVDDPAAFVAKMCRVARRALIITVPQRGLWGAWFAAAGRLRKIRIYRHHRQAPGAWAPGWRCNITEVGLHTRLTKGLTLVAALEPH